MTGLLPSLCRRVHGPILPKPTARCLTPRRPILADQIITPLVRHALLAHTKGRPPFRLAGLETSERLRSVAGAEPRLAGHALRELRLAQLYQGLQTALAPFAETYQDIHQGAAWLRDIAYILEPVPTHSSALRTSQGNSAAISDSGSGNFEAISTLETFGRHLGLSASAGAIGLACSIAMRSRSQDQQRGGKPLSRDASSVPLRTTGQQGKRSGRCNARAPGNSCPTCQQRRSYRRSFVKPLSRTWRRSGNVLFKHASVSAGRAVP